MPEELTPGMKEHIERKGRMHGINYGITPKRFAEAVEIFVDKPTQPHKFIPNHAGQCQGCIYPKEHQIHIANLQKSYSPFDDPPEYHESFK